MLFPSSSSFNSSISRVIITDLSQYRSFSFYTSAKKIQTNTSTHIPLRFDVAGKIVSSSAVPSFSILFFYLLLLLVFFFFILVVVAECNFIGTIQQNRQIINITVLPQLFIHPVNFFSSAPFNFIKKNRL